MCPQGNTTGASKFSPQISHRRAASSVRRPGAFVGGGKSVVSGTEFTARSRPFIMYQMAVVNVELSVILSTSCLLPFCALSLLVVVLIVDGD